MENVKYIPGDLVMTNGVPICTAKDVVYRVVASKPNRTETFKSGKVLKGAVTLDNADEKGRGKGYLLVESGAWVKDIIPIKLTTDILVKNGWKQTNHVVDNHGFEYYTLENEKSVDVQYYPKADWADSDSFSAFCGDTEIRPDIHYLHELQHVMFGLDCYVDLKV